MLPSVFDIFSPFMSMKPWAKTFSGSGRPALMSMAGQYRQWKRVMFLPMTWTSAGHHLANAASSPGKPAPVT
jgi:hypothetical protein